MKREFKSVVVSEKVDAWRVNSLGLLYHTTCEEDCTHVRVPQEEREDSTMLMCLFVLQSARDGLNALILKHPTQKS